MDKYEIEYTDRFKEELERIRRYILLTLENPVSAQSVVEVILMRCKELRFLPEGTAVKCIVGGVSFRYAHAKNYTIVYSSDRKKRLVTVHAVMYSRRDIERVLRAG